MKCRFCGCTDERACPGGCAWVAPGVCSNPECIEGYFEETAIRQTQAQDPGVRPSERARRFRDLVEGL